jgi:hypothetical protein
MCCIVIHDPLTDNTLNPKPRTCSYVLYCLVLNDPLTDNTSNVYSKSSCVNLDLR